MSKPVNVRVGMASAREMELKVDDGDKLATDFEKAVADGQPLLWITDSKGHRHGLVVSKVAFLEIENDEERTGIGFSPS
ncbi:MAG: DUF3107 family protein [Acidimicrobiia bacterium]|nr:DUF3107 family protein [Acidimicrobiia bacterium]NNF65823.1 DUF3107 family protein [Acidimicrobiia bacterium]